MNLIRTRLLSPLLLVLGVSVWFLPWYVPVVAILPAIPLAQWGIVYVTNARSRRQHAPGAAVVRRTCEELGVTPPRRVVLGRRVAFYPDSDTLAVTNQWLERRDHSPELASAILAHEMGHRSQLVTSVSAALLVQYYATNIIIATSLVGLLMGRVSAPAALAVSVAFMLGTLLSRSADRALEYDADQFAADLGYAPVLAAYLSGTPSRARSPLSRHPASAIRARRLRARPDYSPLSA